MNDVITALKIGISEHLTKQGSSLEELEASLAAYDESTGQEKLAFFGELASAGMKGVGLLGQAAIKAPEMALASALLLGSTGGAAMYSANKHISDQDKSHIEKQQEAARLQQLTQRLKTEHGI